MTTTTTTRTSAGGRGAILTAALTVATAASVATAHGLYQVAAASRVPTSIAWLYPVITDGLALVAYAATARLHDRGRRYAATIVVLAAGLSGVAQAVYLAGALDHALGDPLRSGREHALAASISESMTKHFGKAVSIEPPDNDSLLREFAAFCRGGSFVIE